MTAARLAGLAEAERSAQEVEREPRVDDVLDEEHVAACERRVDVLEEPDASVLAVGVRGQLDHVERVGDSKRAREIGEEHDARLERRDEDGIEAVVFAPDLLSQLGDPGRDLPAREVHGADLAVLGVVCVCHYEARRSR